MPDLSADDRMTSTAEVKAAASAGQPFPTVALPPRLADGDRLSESSKLEFVDTLRGLAILMVVGVHHGQVFADVRGVAAISGYGQMGVQLFFVASAFTMCLSMSSRRSEQHPVTSFFIRRFFRVAPLYYLGLALYFCVALLENHGAAPPLYAPGNVVANLLFVHGFVPSAYNNLVLGGWSIAAEVSFYLLFPLLFLLYRTAHARFGSVALVGLPLLGLAFNLALQLLVGALTPFVIHNNSFLYCNIVNQLPVFLVGMSAYFLIAVDDRFAPRPGRDLACLAGLTLCAAALLRAGTPVAVSLLPAASALSFVFLLNLARAHRQKIGIIERIGQVSYSMYIFHFLFAWQATRALRRLAISLPHEAVLLYPLTLALTVLGAYAVGRFSKLFIEDRFIAYGRRWIAMRDARRPATAPGAERR